MRLLMQIFSWVLVSFLFLGCAKKSGIEGKVVDGKGQPVANMKVIAKQSQPIKGYEQFETKTDSDGNFSFKGVYPASEYVLKAEDVVEEKIQSGPEGEISVLPTPIEIRFLILQEGVITDTETGLQWAQDDGGQKMDWFQANDYAHNLKLGGYTDWRLSSKKELESLINYAESKGVKEEINNYFNKLGFKNVQPSVYWSSTTGADISDGAWVVSFGDGYVYDYLKGSAIYVRCVRGGQ